MLPIDRLYATIERTPSSIAVGGDAPLTYHELATRSTLSPSYCKLSAPRAKAMDSRCEQLGSLRLLQRRLVFRKNEHRVYLSGLSLPPMRCRQSGVHPLDMTRRSLPWETTKAKGNQTAAAVEPVVMAYNLSPHPSPRSASFECGRNAQRFRPHFISR